MSKKMRVSPHETMDTGMYAGIKKWQRNVQNKQKKQTKNPVHNVYI